MGKLYYLDNNATTQVDPEVFKAMAPYYMENFGNPSGVYSFAQKAKQDVEAARAQVAEFLNAAPSEIIFTSGGTEADNLAIKGAAHALKEKGRHIITTAIEHHAVLNTCEFLGKNGWEITYLPVDEYGLVNPEILKAAIRKDTVIISIMYANNEIGTIEPIKELADIAREAKVYFHTDAVQVAGKIKLDVKELGVDMLSLSGHKIYGPKGIGVLYLKKGTRLSAMMHGGHHENNRRAGTENVPAIIGLGKACELAKKALEEGVEEKRIKGLRDRLEKELLGKVTEVVVNGHPVKRLDNTLNIIFKYIEGEGILIHMDFEGICASSGSACTSGSLDPSHVLLAIGLPHEIAHSSIRFSFGRFSTEADVDKVMEVLPPAVEKLRMLSPFWHNRDEMLKKDGACYTDEHGHHGHEKDEE